MATKNTTYRRRIESAERAAQAGQMYMDGYSLRAIGRELSVSHVQAKRYIEAHLKAIPAATREELQRQTLEQYASLIDAYNPAALDGDIGAAGVILKALEARRKMFGLDAPTGDEEDEAARARIVAPRIVFTNDLDRGETASG